MKRSGLPAETDGVLRFCKSYIIFTFCNFVGEPQCCQYVRRPFSRFLEAI